MTFIIITRYNLILLSSLNLVWYNSTLPFCCFQEYSPDLTVALWVYTQGNGDMTILSNGIRSSATIGMFVKNELLKKSIVRIPV